MSITADPIIETHENNPLLGDNSRSPKHSARNLGLRVALSIIGISIVGVVALTIGIFVLGGNSTDSVTSGTDTLADVTPSSSAVSTAPSVIFQDRADLLLTFGNAWTAGDFESMRPYASDAVITTAQDWHSGGSAAITTDNVDDIVAGCTDVGSCQFLYAPPEGYGLIFDATISSTANGLVISGLSFGGDAG